MRRKTATASQLRIERLLHRARSGLRLACAFYPTSDETFAAIEAEEAAELRVRAMAVDSEAPGVRMALVALDEADELAAPAA